MKLYWIYFDYIVKYSKYYTMSSVSDCELSSITISSIPPPPKKIQNTPSKSLVCNKIYNWDTFIIVICSILGTMFIGSLITLILGMAGTL